MRFNFEEITPREGTFSYKYGLRKKIFGTDDVYPMWVADTEFKAPGFILNALQKRLDHGIFGYTLLDDGYYRSIINWLEKRHSWSVKKEWIKYSPGVVPSLFASVLAFTGPGDKVIIQTPVYHPFYSAIRETGREIITNPLILKDGRYYMDLKDLKSKIDNKTKMIFLCSPHNPTGNVWKQNELEGLTEICLEKNILIVSDEIHADIVYKPNKHIPTATLSKELSQQTITLMAPSKTFNIAGLNSSYIIAENEKYLNQLAFYFEGLHIGPDIFAIEATKAAYKEGAEWLGALLSHYEKNIGTVRGFLQNELPKIKLVEPEGTFLLWLDFREFNLNRKELNERIINGAKLGYNDGNIFGPEGAGFQRMNIGCQHSELLKALEMLSSAFKKL